MLQKMLKCQRKSPDVAMTRTPADAGVRPLLCPFLSSLFWQGANHLRKEAGRRQEVVTWPHKVSAKAREQTKNEGPRNMGADGRKLPTDGTLPTGTDTQLHYVGQSK